MLVSRTSMKAAIETTKAISQGLALGRQGSGAERGAMSFTPERSVCESIGISALRCGDAGASVSASLVDATDAARVVYRTGIPFRPESDETEQVRGGSPQEGCN